jgi:hypothetical protein
MASDLSRFLRAVKTIDRLVHKYPHEEAWIRALGRYATIRQEGEIWHVGDFLGDIGRELSSMRDGVKATCKGCGKEICDSAKYNDRDPRSDAQYCSARCRQKAYRKRVTASIAVKPNKRNGIAASLQPAYAERHLRRAMKAAPHRLVIEHRFTLDELWEGVQTGAAHLIPRQPDYDGVNCIPPPDRAHAWLIALRRPEDHGTVWRRVRLVTDGGVA